MFCITFTSHYDFVFDSRMQLIHAI